MKQNVKKSWLRVPKSEASAEGIGCAVTISRQDRLFDVVGQIRWRRRSYAISQTEEDDHVAAEAVALCAPKNLISRLFQAETLLCLMVLKAFFSVTCACKVQSWECKKVALLKVFFSVTCTCKFTELGMQESSTARELEECVTRATTHHEK